MAPAAKAPAPRPYRDFLVPLLHHRFNNAIPAILLLCLITATIMGRIQIFYIFIRTVLLLIPCMMVFVLRVSTMRVGARNSEYPAQTAWRVLSNMEWLAPIIWYSMSAWLFSEIYMWSAPESMKLTWIDYGKSYEKPKLNERPVYVRTMFLLLAGIQTLVHLYHDYDRLPVASEQPKVIKPTAPTERSQTSSSPPVAEQYFPQWARQALLGSVNAIPWRIAAVVLCQLSYFLPLVPIRSIAVYQHRWVAEYVLAYTLPGHGPISVFREKGYLMIVTLIWCLVLTFLWECCNLSFTHFVAAAPMKKGQLLTAESKDPNGSLIIGLKGKKELSKAMAFWELALLARDHPVRRQTIYQEFERAGGSSWTQISELCVKQIKLIDQRINPKPVDTSLPQPRIQTLPKIADQGILNDTISTDQDKPRLLSQAGAADFAKSIGQTPGAEPPIASPARKLLAYGSEHTSSLVSRADIQSQTNGLWAQFLTSPIGTFFRHTVACRATATIHGAPIGEESIIQNAASALSQLMLHSLKEDTPGMVQKDTASIIRVYVTNIRAIEKFIKELTPHPSDVDFVPADKKVDEVEETLKSLKVGLEGILGAFAEYAEDLGLSNRDLVEAKAAANHRK